jgi:hypothetical protein
MGVVDRPAFKTTQAFEVTLLLGTVDGAKEN